MPVFQSTRRMTVSQIRNAIGDNLITHLCIEGEIPDRLSELTPKLKKLKLERISDIKQLDRLVSWCFQATRYFRHIGMWMFIYVLLWYVTVVCVVGKSLWVFEGCSSFPVCAFTMSSLRCHNSWIMGGTCIWRCCPLLVATDRGLIVPSKSSGSPTHVLRETSHCLRVMWTHFGTHQPTRSSSTCPPLNYPNHQHKVCVFGSNHWYQMSSCDGPSPVHNDW